MNLRAAHIAILYIFLIATYSPAQQASAVMQNLKSFDTLYSGGVSVSATETTLDRLGSRATSIVRRNWTFTYDGDRCAYGMNLAGYDGPQFRSPRSKATSDPATSQTWLLPLRTKTWGYWGGDLCGNLYIDTTIRLNSAAKAEKLGESYNVSRFNPRDIAPEIPKCAILWSLGRMFSKVLSNINSVQNEPDGTITVLASGLRGGSEGVWRLRIDPAAEWMVREAVFRDKDNPDAIACQMINTGIHWNGTLCSPVSALFSYVGPVAIGYEFTQQIEFQSIEPKFNVGLYSEARDAVVNSKFPDVSIHDYQTVPPLLVEPDSMKSQLLQSLPSDISSGLPAERRLLPVLSRGWAITLTISSVILILWLCSRIWKSRKS